MILNYKMALTRENIVRHSIIAPLILVLAVMMLDCGKDGGPSEPSIPNPIASFTVSGDTVSPATITFQNTSQNADTYLWRFGDGDSTTITNPTHTYDTHGDYMVTLRAENSSTGLYDLEFKQINITPGRVFIQEIRIENMPFSDEYGSGWDLFSGPDVYSDLATTLDIVFTLRSYYHLDVAPSDLPIQWLLSSGYEITDWSTAYFVLIWDYDNTGDDYIGSSNGFRINDVIATEGYVSTVARENGSGAIRTVVTLRWE